MKEACHLPTHIAESQPHSDRQKKDKTFKENHPKVKRITGKGEMELGQTVSQKMNVQSKKQE